MQRLVRLGEAASDFYQGPWINFAWGVLNAWVVTVGPSPGAPDQDSSPHAPSVLWPSSAEVLRRLTTVREKPFFKNLSSLLCSTFTDARLLDSHHDPYFHAMLHMNLEPETAGVYPGDPSRLISSLGRLWFVAEVARPRVILALGWKVYDAIQQGASLHGIGRLENREPYRVPGAGRGDMYQELRSCWLQSYGSPSRILICETPHPNRLVWNRISPYRPAVLARIASLLLEASTR